MNDLIGLIENWAKERNIDKGEPSKQMLKMNEELGELAQGIAKNNQEQITDSLGDVFVVLTILSMQLGRDLKTCVEIAYEEIKNRKGKTVNGIFVKESDIN